MLDGSNNHQMKYVTFKLIKLILSCVKTQQAIIRD